ncbi:MAG: PKD domain-containing protein, partial [Bacteroidales bacterium]|nr:PKD domain-containing protein [Bacteroidales bacterium]
MKQRYYIFVIVLFLLCSFPLYAQYDIKGTEFWLTLGSNSSKSYDTVNLEIRIISGNQSATGIIYFTHLNDSVFFSIAAWNVFTHKLTLAQRQVVYNDITGISDYSVCITTNTPVTIYALNQYPATTDATHILPVTALGTDYYHISYLGHNDAYAFIATQNNTHVYYNGTLAAVLNKGEVYYYNLFRSNDYDMTGNHVISDKPIAFFSLYKAIEIPSDRFYAQDVLFEQLAPVSTWGKNFFVPVSHRVRDIVRIVASQNGTNISQTGGTILTSQGGQTKFTNLNAGQWVELEVSLDSNGCYIQANKPVGVCTYLTGYRYNLAIIGNTISDPAQAWLPAIEQKIKSSLVVPFVPCCTTNINSHHVLVITSTATKDSTTVKIGIGTEQSLSGGAWYDHSSGYSFYNMPLTNDTSTYLFTNLVGGLIVMGYGMGRAESYYYLLASAMRNLGAVFYVNDIHYQEFDSITICEQTLQFHAEIDGEISTEPGHLKWYINSVEEIAARDQFTWSKAMSPGVYQIKMVILYEDNMTTQTLETIFTIVNIKIDVETTPEICGKENGTIILTVESKEPTTLKYVWEGQTDTTATITGLKAGIYKVTISDTFCIDEETITVEQIKGPVAEFEANPQTASLGEEIQFIDKSNQGDTKITNWYWNFGDERDSYLQNSVHRYTTFGSFIVSLQIADEYGCTDSISHEVMIFEGLDFPNIFSPVGSDGKKYVFRPLEDRGTFEEFKIEIYDKWGVLVWEQACKSPNCPDYSDSFWW